MSILTRRFLAISLIRCLKIPLVVGQCSRWTTYIHYWEINQAMKSRRWYLFCILNSPPPTPPTARKWKKKHMFVKSFCIPQKNRPFLCVKNCLARLGFWLLSKGEESIFAWVPFFHFSCLYFAFNAKNALKREKLTVSRNKDGSSFVFKMRLSV